MADWKFRPDEDGYYWYRHGEPDIFSDDIEVGTLDYDARSPQVVRIQGRMMYVTGSSIVLEHLLLTGQFKKVNMDEPCREATSNIQPDGLSGILGTPVGMGSD